MLLLRAAMRITGWAIGIYLTLWVAAYLLWPLVPPDQPLDGLNGNSGLYGDNVREIVYSLPERCNASPRRRLIILGGSSATAYRPEILRTATDADEVDNLALNSSNISQIHQLVTDVIHCFGRETMRSSTFLVITGYFLFVDNSQRWNTGFTVYEGEKVRFGLYSGSPNALVPTFGTALMPWAVDALRPVFAFSRLKALSSRLMFSLVKRVWIRPTVEKAYHKTIERVFPKTVNGTTFGVEQFQELDRLVSDIRASGAGLIFVEQPIETFDRRSQIYASYASRMALFTANHRIPVIDLTTSANDSEFADPYHGADGSFAVWTQRLASKLRARSALRSPLVERHSG